MASSATTTGQDPQFLSLKSRRSLYMPAGKEWGVVLADGTLGTVVIDFDGYLQQLGVLARTEGTGKTRLAAFNKNDNFNKFVESVGGVYTHISGYSKHDKYQVRQALAHELRNPTLMDRFVAFVEPSEMYIASKNNWPQLKVARWVENQLSPKALSKYTRVITLGEFDAAVNRALLQSVNSDALNSLTGYIKLMDPAQNWRDLDAFIIKEAALAFADTAANTRGAFDAFVSKWWAEHHNALKFQALEKVANDPHLAEFVAANF